VEFYCTWEVKRPLCNVDDAKDRYAPRIRITCYQILHWFTRLQIKDNDDLQEHLKHVQNLKIELEEQEIDVSNDLYIMVLLESVSSAYAIPMSVFESQEDITLTMIINRLLEENRKLHEEGAERSKLEISMVTNYRGKLRTWSHKANHRSGGNGYCRIYKLTMHNNVDCWIKDPEKWSIRKPYGGRTKGTHEDSKMAMSAYVSITPTDHAWIIDSEATNHLCPHRDLFDNYLALSQSMRI
jgi:gag-polypeptide of LTR copia-type